MVDPHAEGDGKEGVDRIAELVERLTRAEKLRLVHGTYPDWGHSHPGAAGYLPPIDRLEIPALRFEDGPLGVKSSGGTAFPSALAIGASFDDGLAAEFGKAVGTEARAHDVDIVLAPGCNLVRVPHCGRNFEYYGEDPHHSARLAAATVSGIQSQGVVATPKHYVANNQEYERVNMSAEVDERALRELYLPAFEAAITDGGAGAVMAAYNRINGTYATEHKTLLTDVLKDEFGFEGPIISDWWAVRNGVGAATAGLDLEMPGVGVIDWAAMLDDRLHALRVVENYWPEKLPGPEEAAAWLFKNKGGPGGDAKPHRSVFSQTLSHELNRSTVTADRLDEMVKRVLTLHERVGALDRQRRLVDENRTAHRKLAKRIATHGTVLLKNSANTLPLNRDAKIAVIGPHIDEAKTGGGGSSEVWTSVTVSPLDGIRSRSTGPVLAEQGHHPIGTSLPFEWGLTSRIRGGLGRDTSIEDAQSVATEADVAVVVVQDAAAEGRDRASLSLPGHQDALVSAVADVTDRTIVVIQTAGPIEMPWIDDVASVIEMWYPGQEAGRALAEILYGDVDPGGRLPVTFAAEEEYPTNVPKRYPGIKGASGHPEACYSEGIFVGYRHFNEYDIEALFPFGHGLSYTKFEYNDVEMSMDHDELAVSMTVKNTGDRRGRDVVQLYVRDRDTNVRRPPRELGGFEVVALDADETRSIDVAIDERAFAFYSKEETEWVTEPGEYILEVGRSSQDIRATTTVSF